MSRVEYNKGRATQVLGTISLHQLDGDFDDVISSLQKERTSYIKEYVKKAGEVRGIYADMKNPKIDCNDYGSSYFREEKRALKFDKIRLSLVDVHDYDGERQEFVVYGDRDITEVEQAALDAEQEARQLAQKERDRLEFERLKAKLEKENNV